MADIIHEGNHVVLKKTYDEENMKIFKVELDKPIYYGKLKFTFNKLIGATYGTIFEIKDNDMYLVEDFQQIDSEFTEILTNSSSTFSDKSQFSQEKIIKKKKRRYLNFVTILKPSIRLINEVYFSRDKVGGLRLDTLSQIITSCNIQNGTKSLVVDNNLGLVTAAVVSRSCPDGKCIQVAMESGLITSYRHAVDTLDINSDTLTNTLFSISIKDIYRISQGLESFDEEDARRHQRTCYRMEYISKKREELKERSEGAQDDGTERTGDQSSQESDKKEYCLKLDLIDENLLKKEANRHIRKLERDRAAAYLRTKCLDALIIVTQNYHPLPLFKLLFPFLLPSRQFAIYSDTVEPLIECQHYLKTEACAVSISLSETWLRKYQVLPDRTRPEMNTSGFGGYLLCGTKVILNHNNNDDCSKISEATKCDDECVPDSNVQQDIKGTE